VPDSTVHVLGVTNDSIVDTHHRHEWRVKRPLMEEAADCAHLRTSRGLAERTLSDAATGVAALRLRVAARRAMRQDLGVKRWEYQPGYPEPD
jgi:hypothetical protein